MAKRGKGKKRSGSSSSTSGPSETPGAEPSAKQSRREERRQQRERQKRRQRALQLGALAVVVVVALTAALWPQLQGGSAQGVGDDRLVLDPVIGGEDAPVTIVEFGDFGCPSCRAWHLSGIKNAILNTYGDRVQFVWKDFPVITARSPAAARAGQCALDQGHDAFWDFHDLVYERGDIRLSSLVAYTEELSLIDRAEFERCVDSDRHESTVERDMAEARELRLRGTPSFVVNGRVLPGPPRYEQLARLIEEALEGGE